MIADRKIVFACGYDHLDPFYDTCKSLLSFHYKSHDLEFRMFTSGSPGDYKISHGSGSVVTLSLENPRPTEYYGSNGRLTEPAKREALEKTLEIYKYLLNFYDDTHLFYVHTVTSVIHIPGLITYLSSIPKTARIYAGKIMFPFIEGQPIPMLSGAGKLMDYQTLEHLIDLLPRNQYLVENDVAEGLLTQHIEKRNIERHDYSSEPRLSAINLANFRKDLISRCKSGQFHFRFRSSGLDNRVRLGIDTAYMATAIDTINKLRM